MWVLVLVGCGGLGLVPTETDGSTVEAGAGDTVGSEAAPVDVPLLAHTWSVDLAAVTWAEPPGISSIVAMSSSSHILFNVVAETSDSLTFAVALAAADGGQNPCERVIDLPPAQWDNPRWTIADSDLPLSVGGGSVEIKDTRFTAVVSENAQTWTDGSLEGTLDARELEPSLGADIDVCQLISSMGGACVPCSDGAASCFDVVVEDLAATTVNSSFNPDVDDSAC